MSLFFFTVFYSILVSYLQPVCGSNSFFSEVNYRLPEHLLRGIPQQTDLILTRRGFSLGYSRKYRQALWVIYILRAEDLEKERVARSRRFQADPAVGDQAVLPRNYLKTGYDRGHLAPAADMAYSMEAMEHSFFMTNISPQIPGCNRGIWKRLENQVRRWAVKERELCVVTGPVFGPEEKNCGENGIPVPRGFYKVILDLTPPVKMIGFVIPNEPAGKRLDHFVTTVDRIEALTGNDFFSVLPDELENRLEAEADFREWR
ncbi:MAG TPA: DNA/RNA non-specific endonuclease [Victivallis vadensis]|uniref:DNA/RNA non-specific endonuclease n=1 Tax=Victivallis vadensis TaxID=172901 RepID=UPI001E012F08|nr:DNA/RNA non-specific endonuclease [Victivallis vadensis]HJH04145.1 DNA/RNA non-specific endonuclease [Victivallis vadensis]